MTIEVTSMSHTHCTYPSSSVLHTKITMQQAEGSSKCASNKSCAPLVPYLKSLYGCMIQAPADFTLSCSLSTAF